MGREHTKRTDVPTRSRAASRSSTLRATEPHAVRGAASRRTQATGTPTGGGLPLADERAYLYGIIRTIGAGPDLRSVLAGVVRLATEATSCHACLIWFSEGDRLVLRSSSAPYMALAGRISVRLGEGLVGWVARTGRSAVIEEDALQDPRVRYFPELEEEDFQSLVAVPVFGRDGTVMGVISLHAEAPHEFARDDLEFLEHTASLIAGAVENARLYEDSAARVDLLTDLSRLSRRIAAAAEVDEVFDAVCTGVRDLLNASACDIWLVDGEGRAELAASEPARDAPGPIEAAALARAAEAGSRAARRLGAELWGAGSDGSTYVEPLTVGDERLGWLVAAIGTPPPGAATVLSAVAAHAAVAIRRLDLMERLLEKNLVSEFFDALARSDERQRVHALARRLDIDIDDVHVTAVATDTASEPGRPSRTWPDVASRLEAAAAARLPGAWFERTDRAVRMLIPASRGVEAIRAGLEAVVGTLGASNVSVGISEPCDAPDGYPAAFGEAWAAVEVGSLLRSGPGVTSYGELGAYRYVLASPEVSRDADRRRLERLVTYDRRRGTALLDTLERFLDERGNVVATARALFIHPNTLRQRLERIEVETGIDLEQDDWLSLAIAVKVIRLERLRARRAKLRRGSESGSGRAPRREEEDA